MKLGIMQPYFFPYLGYWLLMNAVDHYVVYDAVNFIKGGRINRNAILSNGNALNINLILSGASPNKLINEVEVNPDPVSKNKLLKTIEMSYSKAPYFNDVMPMIRDIVLFEESNLAKYLFNSFKVISQYLNINWSLSLIFDIF